MSGRQQVLRFKGCTHFRQRLICSILSGKSIKITEIRANLESPGLQGEHIFTDFITSTHSTNHFEKKTTKQVFCV